MNAERNLFDVLERRGSTGFFPLNENHWSNVLAWLLEPEGDGSFGRSILGILVPAYAGSKGRRIDREFRFEIEERPRLADIAIAFANGSRCLIEVKIDRSNLDKSQLSDQLRILRSGDYFTLLAPLDLAPVVSELRDAYPAVEIHTLSWRSLGERCLKITELSAISTLQRCVLDGIADYWCRARKIEFDEMARTVIEENGWTSLYPDDFKEAFLTRFPDVWAAWVAQKRATGNGSPHQYLLTCLAKLASRKNGFRLKRTGRSRPPKIAGWGFPVIFELELVAD